MHLSIKNLLKMKKLHIIILLVLAFGIAIAQDKEPYQVKKIAGVDIQKLKVQTSGGAIKVKGSEGKDAEIRMFVNKNSWGSKASKSEIEEELKNYSIEIGFQSNAIVCIAKPKDPNGRNNKLSIGFEVDLPSKVDVELGTAGGSINLNNLDGILNFKSSGGSLSVAHLRGTINGKTSGGSIKLSVCDGNISMKTSGGSIDATDSKGKIDLATSGGSIHLENLKGTIKGHTSGGSVNSKNIKGSLEVATSGGSIELDGISGDLVASTSAGSIDANIVKLGNVLKLNTSAGNIHANLPFSEGMDLDLKANKIKSDKLAKVSKNLDSGKVQGRVNGGGTEVKMTTSGTIYIE